MNPCPIKILSRCFAVILVVATPALPAAASDVEVSKSRITATFRQMSVPIEGRFKIFRGVIDFDPKKLKEARARIEIDTASFDLGAPEYEEELRGKEWFDTSTYPKASFVSSGVTAVSDNRFEAKGALTLKGKIQDIKLRFTLLTDGVARVFEGDLPISRKAFALGSAAWDDTLEDQVIVKFRLVAK